MFFKLIMFCVCTAILLNLLSCAGQSKKIATGMLAGAVVGAAVGHEFVHHGEFKQYETKNTIITSIVFSLVTGGFLSWHYQAIQDQQVEISGRYARYRLCNPEEMESGLAQQLGFNGEEKDGFQIKKNQIGKLAISLDDNTKWKYPIFRKRFLEPERGEMQVLSKRYIWEIIKPGSFVTRFQNPEYFYEEKEK